MYCEGRLRHTFRVDKPTWSNIDSCVKRCETILLFKLALKTAACRVVGSLVAVKEQKHKLVQALDKYF